MLRDFVFWMAVLCVLIYLVGKLVEKPRKRTPKLSAQGYDTDVHVNRAANGNVNRDRESQLLSNLRTACFGDCRAADRLVEYELSLKRGPRIQAIEHALDRLKIDRGRYK
ncbi:MAG: hypothetical protein JWR21_2004 [Herminiimonas sp.]|nr:hypothetical protein [Herminiimonas sp.]MDB5852972.1 hypothetical protein [Herminiimonas sp.]